MLSCGLTGTTRRVLHWMLEAGGRNLLNARSRWGHHAIHFAAANCHGGASLLQELLNYFDLLKELDISGAQTLSFQARELLGVPADTPRKGVSACCCLHMLCLLLGQCVTHQPNLDTLASR